MIIYFDKANTFDLKGGLMTKIMTLTLLLLLTSSASFAGAKCKKGIFEISCAGVAGAKKKSFCSKRKLTEEKKNRICKTMNKKRKLKKKSNKAS